MKDYLQKFGREDTSETMKFRLELEEYEDAKSRDEAREIYRRNLKRIREHEAMSRRWLQGVIAFFVILTLIWGVMR